MKTIAPSLMMLGLISVLLMGIAQTGRLGAGREGVRLPGSSPTSPPANLRGHSTRPMVGMSHNHRLKLAAKIVFIPCVRQDPYFGATSGDRRS